MKKYTYFSIVVGVIILFGLYSTASAHILQSDDDIGAILHVYPDDNPITGRPTEYIVSFTDITKRFSLKRCDCFVSYKLDDKVISTQRLVASTDLDSKNSFTFSDPGVYDIEITGTPTRTGEFEPFELMFTKRVVSDGIVAQEIPITLVIGITGAVGLLLLAVYVMNPKETQT